MISTTNLWTNNTRMVTPPPVRFSPLTADQQVLRDLAKEVDSAKTGLVALPVAPFRADNDVIAMFGILNDKSGHNHIELHVKLSPDDGFVYILGFSNGLYDTSSYQLSIFTGLDGLSNLVAVLWCVAELINPNVRSISHPETPAQVRLRKHDDARQVKRRS